MRGRPSPNRREHFRLQFPRRERALVRTERGRFPVLNISAGGALLDVDLPQPSDPLTGTLRLPSGTIVHFDGHIWSRSPGQWVLEFRRGPSVEQMLDEQRRLIRSYSLTG